MEPGYYKNTKYLSINRDDTGVVDKNQVVDLIREFSSETQFYEIEPAIVTHVYLNPKSEQFPKRDKLPDYSMIGSIRATFRYSNESGLEIDRPIRPLSPHIVQLPLIGEVVNIANYDGQLYYYNPLNLRGSIDYNGFTGLSSIEIDRLLTNKNRRIKLQPGDTVFQGRYGQTIHFGSDENNAKPNIKISCGQGFSTELNGYKNVHPNFPHEENINNDEASIYITTAEHIPLVASAKSKDKTVKTTGPGSNMIHSNIILNADSLIFNSRKTKISLFSNTNINLTATNEINLETENGTIHLLDPNARNPLVKGRQLKSFLSTLISSVENHSLALSNVIAVIANTIYEGKNKELVQYLNDINNDFFNKIQALKDEVSVKNKDTDFLSSRVFIGTNATDNNWDDPKWENPQEEQSESL
mgnify:CR=1 FL=1